MNANKNDNRCATEAQQLRREFQEFKQQKSTQDNRLHNDSEIQSDNFSEVFQKSLDVLIIVAPRSHKILRVNDKVAQLFGYQPNDLIGKNFEMLYPENNEQNGRHFFTEMKAFDGVLTDQPFLHNNGETVLVDLTAVIIHWQNAESILINIRDTRERRQAEKIQEQLVRDLQEALDNVKLLKGLLPICSHCKKIRDDAGYWTQIEEYIHEHSEAEFSHSICPTCIKTHYGDLNLPELDADAE